MNFYVTNSQRRILCTKFNFNFIAKSTFATVGIGGSGRQSAAKLSTFMADYELFQIEITKNYTSNEWREDVKKVKLFL